MLKLCLRLYEEPPQRGFRILEGRRQQRWRTRRFLGLSLFPQWLDLRHPCLEWWGY